MGLSAIPSNMHMYSDHLVQPVDVHSASCRQEVSQWTPSASGGENAKYTREISTSRIFVDIHSLIREESVAHEHDKKVKDITFEILKTNCKLAAVQNLAIRPPAALRSELANLENTTT